MIELVLIGYPSDCQPTSVESLRNAGGFSGAMLWKLQTARGELCLRRWPPQHPDAARLRWIHWVLHRANSKGCDFVPLPINTLEGDTFVARNGLWELTPWMPGTAALATNCSADRLAIAMLALAQFHVAVAELGPGSGPSPGIRRRAETARQMVSHQLEQWQRDIGQHQGQPFYVECTEILRLAAPLVRKLSATLAPIEPMEFVLQPCLRDIWYEHILFVDDRVTGIVDFGAMQDDTVACDLARLLGSLVELARAEWPGALAAYESVRPLAETERVAINAFHRSGKALSGLNWVRWLMFDGKSFENEAGVRRRLRDIIAAMSVA